MEVYKQNPEQATCLGYGRHDDSVQHGYRPYCAHGYFMTPKDHIDLIQIEITRMAEEGHFNEVEASVVAGAVEYELSRLLDELEKE